MVPLPVPSSSVIDADEVVRPERPPSHPVKVEVDDEVLRRPAPISLGAEGVGDQVEASRARCGARLSADLAEGKLDGAPCEAGTKDANEIGHWRSPTGGGSGITLIPISVLCHRYPERAIG